jgi:hypothetical protein
MTFLSENRGKLGSNRCFTRLGVKDLEDDPSLYYGNFIVKSGEPRSCTCTCEYSSSVNLLSTPHCHRVIEWQRPALSNRECKTHVAIPNRDCHVGFA